MYKPNFCAECGARIVRERWRFWNSRIFCPECARRFRKAQILLPVIAGLMLFGIGLTVGRTSHPAPPPLVLQSSRQAPVPAIAAAAGTLMPSSNAETSPGSTGPESSYGRNGTAGERPTDPHEIVSVCGARTKKGTPCSRRVRGTGRCWQHKGMPAITAYR